MQHTLACFSLITALYTIAACDEDCHFDLHGSLGWYSLPYEDCHFNLCGGFAGSGTVCHMKTVILTFMEVAVWAGTVCHMKTVIWHLQKFGLVQFAIWRLSFWLSQNFEPYEDCHFAQTFGLLQFAIWRLSFWPLWKFGLVPFAQTSIPCNS